MDVIHSHGLWMLPNIYARRAALGNHLPLIISTHGMLESWSLKNSQFKKKLALLLYERKNLQSATVLHAASLEEAKSIRRLGLKQPIALIPNAADLPNKDQFVGKEVLIQVFPELAEKRWLLFMSRLHPKKGLETLLKVWHELAGKFPDWHLILAGPNSIDNYQAELESIVKHLELAERVTFTGMLTGRPKASAMTNSELFVLPTHSENFGIAVAESLSYGVPAITTKAAPWQDLEQYRCGWWIEDDQQTLLNALVEGMELSAEIRLEMGERARALVETRYSWQSTTQQMVEVYHWLVGKGQPPQCIQFCDDK
ncbi:glycosyltransferase [Leptolyngbya sp. 7M]|nr:glycosyltransferase [Leptolyngbya sp. 7M]